MADCPAGQVFSCDRPECRTCRKNVPIIGQPRKLVFTIKGPSAPGVRDAFQRAAEHLHGTLDEPARVTLTLLKVSQELTVAESPEVEFIGWTFEAKIRDLK